MSLELKWSVWHVKNYFSHFLPVRPAYTHQKESYETFLFAMKNKWTSKHKGKKCKSNTKRTKVKWEEKARMKKKCWIKDVAF